MIKRTQIQKSDKSGKFSSEREKLLKFARENTDFDKGLDFVYSDKAELTAYRNLIYSVNVKLKELKLHPLESVTGKNEKGQNIIAFFCSELNAEEVEAPELNAEEVEA